MIYFVENTEETLVEGLAKLLRDDVWMLYRLLENMISDREPYFVVELTKKLNKMLEIKTKLSTVFYSQTDGQIEHMN